MATENGHDLNSSPLTMLYCWGSSPVPWLRGRYSSDGSSEPGVCKHGQGEWGGPAVCQRLETFAVFKKTPLKWLAKVGFLGMDRIW